MIPTPFMCIKFTARTTSQKMLAFFIAFLLFTFTGISQHIGCHQTLDSIKAYMEKNYVGFTDKVTPATQKAYLAHIRQSYAYAKTAQSRADYLFTIRHWISFFKDHHVYIEVPADTINVEMIRLDEQVVSRLGNTPTSSIEGIYYTRDSTYKVAVVKSKKGLRSYTGVIVNSRTRLWKPGQVKFELIKTGKDSYQGIWYNRNHDVRFSTIGFRQQNGFEQEGWYKQGTVIKTEAVQPLFEEGLNATVSFKTINDSTGYIRIRSFDGAYAKAIDSIIKTNLKHIQSMPRLIIDLRGNGGGSDHSISFLKPIIYTNPVKNIGLDLLTTPDNIAAWEYMVSKYRGKLPDDYLDKVLQRIYRGKGKERELIHFADDETDSLPDIWPAPAKVAIVINRGCGSSTEEFLLIARQSKKVVFAGEHSKGVLDYSNIVPKDFYCPAFTLYYSTTRSRRIDVGLGIDNLGIQPNIPLDLSKNNWLEELLKKF